MTTKHGITLLDGNSQADYEDINQALREADDLITDESEKLLEVLMIEAQARLETDNGISMKLDEHIDNFNTHANDEQRHKSTEEVEQMIEDKIVESGGGPAGISAFVHIRWAASYPPSELLTEPSDYIGIISTTTPNPPEFPEAYKWFKYKGEPGEKGDTGEKGETGAVGPAGAAGKDATALSADAFDFDNLAALKGYVYSETGTRPAVTETIKKASITIAQRKTEVLSASSWRITETYYASDGVAILRSSVQNWTKSGSNWSVTIT